MLLTFSPMQWAVMQIHRRMMHLQIKRRDSGDSRAQAYLDKLFDDVASDPLLKLSTGERNLKLIPDPFSGVARKSIEPMTIGYALVLLNQWRSINGDKAKLLDEADMELREGGTPCAISTKYLGVLSSSLSPNQNIIRIDRQLPREKLLSDFNSWLRTLHGDVAPNTREQRGDLLTRWGKLGVVPYVDLVLWGKYKRLRVTNPAIAEALGANFLNPSTEVEQKVGRTLRKESQFFLSDSAQEKIAAYVASQRD